MGRDKTELPVEGEPLWQRQLNTLRETNPAELFISGPLGGSYRTAGVRIVTDTQSLLGPLGGLTAALNECTTDWLLALAVDLPLMRSEYLLRLVREAKQSGIGIVPTIEGTKFEPLAAVYPKRALLVAEARCSSKLLKLADFVSELENRGWMRRINVSAEEAIYFTNWNSPEDVKQLD